ncbi:MAG: glycosyltransferase [Armatimonadetes bacterium]|nr:glycosyltransferase [Armatimonadota bacterium]
MEGLATERGVPFTRIAGLGREISLKSDLPTVHRVYREIRRYRPDIVHTHLAKAGAVGRLAARLARVPSVVHTYHGHVFHGYFSKRKSAVLVRIERALARATDRIVVLGEAQEREILNFGVGRREQMKRIPLGLELEPFLSAERHAGELRRELGIGAGVPLIGIVARLVPIKAHSLFLDAALLVAHQRPDAEFLVVGDGDLRDSVEQEAREKGFRIVAHDMAGHAETLASKASGPCLRFLGFRSDLPKIYADLDVAVLCSLNEGLPVTIIEALASARPVVATEVGSVGDLVSPGRTGCLVPSGSAESLAEGIRWQLENPEQGAAMAREGRAHVFPRLSVDRLEQDLRALYREFAGL